MEEPTVFKRSVTYSDLRGEALCQYSVNDKNELVSDLQIAYAPKIPTKSSRPGIVKIPLALAKQLKVMPREMHGVPTDILIACSTYASDPTKNTSNLIVGGISNEG